jgi:hypothetical protein
MTTCRICSASCAPEDLLGVEDGGGCRQCNGSPACARCGHSRRHHRGAFGGGAARCNADVPAEAMLALGRCGCEGYTTDRHAFGESVEIVDVELRLRLPGEEPAPQPRLAPVRDLFDSGGGLDDFGEAKPWRPPS